MATLLPRASHSESHLPVLEGIRGMAVLIVVLSHMSWGALLFHPSLNFRGYGTYGVYLFFALSAFLLTRRFLDDPPARTASAGYWVAYAVRRVARIYPLYTLALLSTLISPVVSVALAGPSSPSIPRHLLLLDGNKIFWAIPVEMKFYLLLPFVLVGLQFVAAGRMWRRVAFMVVLIFASTLLLPPARDSHLSIALRDFVSIFLFGSLAAVCWHGLGKAKGAAMRGAWDLVAAVALLAVVAPWVLGAPFGSSHQFVQALLGSDTAWYGIAWALFIFATLAGQGAMKWLFETQFLRVTGLVSFSAYLWHMPIIELLRRPLLDRFEPWLASGVVLAAVAAASVVSYLAVERPMIAAAGRWAQRQGGFDGLQ